MPLLNLFTSAEVLTPGARAELLRRLSTLLAGELGKPERYVMVSLTGRCEMTFGGTTDPACYAELKNVGQLSADRVSSLSQTLCAELGRGLGVAPDRVYIEFTNSDGALWGWNGTTFG